ncbi:hypothetical protein HBB16_21795 [Pseudonocardia sp. MCCB 268]|nr:hypothetical protein [Pseudonocardia cytotoxica]
MFGLFRALRLERHCLRAGAPACPRRCPAGAGITWPGAGDDGTGRDSTGACGPLHDGAYADQRGADQFFLVPLRRCSRTSPRSCATRGVPTRCSGCDDLRSRARARRGALRRRARSSSSRTCTRRCCSAHRLVPRITGCRGTRSTATAPPGTPAAAASLTGRTTTASRHPHGGGQGYNVMGYSYGQLIDDVLDSTSSTWRCCAWNARRFP